MLRVPDIDGSPPPAPITPWEPNGKDMLEPAPRPRPRPPDIDDIPPELGDRLNETRPELIAEFPRD